MTLSFFVNKNEARNWACGARVSCLIFSTSLRALFFFSLPPPPFFQFPVTEAMRNTLGGNIEGVQECLLFILSLALILRKKMVFQNEKYRKKQALFFISRNSKGNSGRASFFFSNSKK